MTQTEIQGLLAQINIEHLNQAMSWIDAEGVPKGRESQSYDVEDSKTGRKYPPPFLIEKAFELSTGKSLPTGFFARIRKGGPHFEKIESLGLLISEKVDTSQFEESANRSY